MRPEEAGKHIAWGVVGMHMPVEEVGNRSQVAAGRNTGSGRSIG